VLLIDDRVPPLREPRDERRVWEPNLRNCAWFAVTIVLFTAAFVVSGFASFVLLCAAIGTGAHAITRVLPYGEGLREYHQ
jgi:hypothetical protein